MFDHTSYVRVLRFEMAERLALAPLSSYWCISSHFLANHRQARGEPMRKPVDASHRNVAPHQIVVF